MEAFADPQLGALWPLFEFGKNEADGHMNVISGLILRINRDVIEKKKEIEEGDTLRDHLIYYTDGKREKQLEYI